MPKKKNRNVRTWPKKAYAFRRWAADRRISWTPCWIWLGFDLDFEVSEGETLHPDFENPDLVVRFSGLDVDLLLANKVTSCCWLWSS